MTRSATLLSITLAQPLRPCVPIMMRSACRFFASVRAAVPPEP